MATFSPQRATQTPTQTDLNAGAARPNDTMGRGQTTRPGSGADADAKPCRLCAPGRDPTDGLVDGALEH
jgi:hypothetical protein